jgi:hypothetical protein
MRRPGATPGVKPTGQQRCAPFCPLWQYASGSLSEIYQTFIGHAPMLELLLDLSPAVVSFHFGLPEGETIQRLRQQGLSPWRRQPRSRRRC